MSQCQHAIDWKLTLTFCNNKADLAEQLINMLAKEIPEHMLAIEQAQKNNQIDIIADRIHKLIGAGSYCGVPALTDICIAIENDIKTNHASNLAKQLPLFYKAANAVLACYQTKSYQS